MLGRPVARPSTVSERLSRTEAAALVVARCWRMAPTVELPHPFTDIDAYLKHLVAFLESHSWLFRNHVVDFVTLDHWQHMPAQWRRPLLECSTGELLCLPVGVCPARADAPVEDGGWPESLVEFIRGASKLALPRVPARDQPKAPAGDDGSQTGLECLGSEPGMELAERHLRRANITQSGAWAALRAHARPTRNECHE